MSVRILLLAGALSLAASGAALADAGHSHSAESPSAAGTPGAKKGARVIEVTMDETDDGRMVFAPGEFRVKRGENVHFRIRNAGDADHEFVIGTVEENLEHAELMKKFPEMEHDDSANGVTLAPGETGDIYWKFARAGELEVRCMIPGHAEAGMVAKVELY
jgi:uncharacterized cupredoxin-like copper-binding protein